MTKGSLSHSEGRGLQHFYKITTSKGVASNSKPRDFSTISHGRQLELSARGEKSPVEKKHSIRQNAEGPKGNCKYPLSYEIPALRAVKTELLRLIYSTLGME